MQFAFSTCDIVTPNPTAIPAIPTAIPTAITKASTVDPCHPESTDSLLSLQSALARDRVCCDELGGFNCRAGLSGHAKSSAKQKPAIEFA
jgi:hypothetical protein